MYDQAGFIFMGALTTDWTHCILQAPEKFAQLPEIWA